MTNSHSLEVVDRGSETQLQVNENVFNLIWRCRGKGALCRFLHIEIERSPKPGLCSTLFSRDFKDSL